MSALFTEMWNGWGKSVNERVGGEKTKLIKEKKKVDEGIRYETNNSPMNFNLFFTTVHKMLTLKYLIRYFIEYLGITFHILTECSS